MDVLHSIHDASVPESDLSLQYTVFEIVDRTMPVANRVESNLVDSRILELMGDPPPLVGARAEPPEGVSLKDAEADARLPSEGIRAEILPNHRTRGTR